MRPFKGYRRKAGPREAETDSRFHPSFRGGIHMDDGSTAVCGKIHWDHRSTLCLLLSTDTAGLPSLKLFYFVNRKCLALLMNSCSAKNIYLLFFELLQSMTSLGIQCFREQAIQPYTSSVPTLEYFYA